MESVNEVRLVGTVEKQLDARKVGAKQLPLTKFVVKTSHTNKFGTKEQLLPVVAWNDNAKIAFALKPGTHVDIRGRIAGQLKEYNGKSNYFTDITADTINILSTTSQAPAEQEDAHDDIPF